MSTMSSLFQKVLKQKQDIQHLCNPPLQLYVSLERILESLERILDCHYFVFIANSGPLHLLTLLY